MKISVVLLFGLATTTLAAFPFEEENTVGATPTSLPWWAQILGGGSTSSSSTTQSETLSKTQAQSQTQTQVEASITSDVSTTSSTSTQPWYAGFFKTTTASTATPTTSLAVSNTQQSQVSASATSTKTTSSQNWFQSVANDFGFGKSSSGSTATNTQSGGSSGSTSSLGDSADSTAETTDETELNDDGNGVANPYSPTNITCPDHDIVRAADGLSDNEKEYVLSKQTLTNEHLIDFLANRANLSDFDAASFINDNADEHNITIGLAFSGGGYRAMLAGAGSILALDNRFEDSNTNGLGGLLQSTTYISGLSGGSWLVGSLVLNNWISVQEILNGSTEIWQLEDSLLNPSSLNLASLAKYYTGIGTAILSKNNAGFQTSVTDVWGRAISHQFFESSSGGSNVTWSSVRNFTTFKDHSMPYFFAVANGKVTDETVIDQNSTFVVEISAYEFGNFDNSLKAFVDTEYLGSSIQGGDADQCVRNFDNAGFIMGTSSSVFNQVLLHLDDYDTSTIIQPVLEMVFQDLSDDKNDVAVYEPNPFYESTYGSIKSVENNHTLSLVDGGEDGQNVPFYPLIQKDRNVDVIFAFDNSADTELNWPNGTSFVETYKWQFTNQGRGTPFPFVPDVDTFLEDNLGERPIFFGCNASDLSPLVDWHDEDDLNTTDIPLIVYMSNNHQSYLSNFSTFKLAYDNAEKTGTIQNGYEVMTSKNLTDDSDWATCVGCAIIRRQQERLGKEQSDECKKCFRDYCWQGTLDDGPEIDAEGLQSNKKNSSSHSTTSSSSSSSSLASNSTRTHSDESTSSDGGAGTISISTTTQKTNGATVAAQSVTGSTSVSSTTATATAVATSESTTTSVASVNNANHASSNSLLNVIFVCLMSAIYVVA